MDLGTVEFEMYLILNVHGWHFDWLVSSVAQILNAFAKYSLRSCISFSDTEYMAKGHNEVDRTTEWHKLLRLSSNVKTLSVEGGLVGELSRSLRLDNEEHPLDLLRELQEVTYSGSGNVGDAVTSFIGAHQTAGLPVTMVPSPI